ncbi:uncharacterized protein N7515_005538 [Penicillium bovifimosum]|uniref:Uncharacterized protein n=1 Tax=Penicillium bovifimosum TaxID=126998 RepID=A0A9W9KZY3_9EURO|nr:uncharacterized protein N7515_005538 [Penicillium bovifimosum]KAJ5129499.1 hypothetical protein N7515_005538 [Penicillium bovifimosum]
MDMKNNIDCYLRDGLPPDNGNNNETPDHRQYKHASHDMSSHHLRWEAETPGHRHFVSPHRGPPRGFVESEEMVVRIAVQTRLPPLMAAVYVMGGVFVLQFSPPSPDFRQIPEAVPGAVSRMQQQQLSTGPTIWTDRRHEMPVTWRFGLPPQMAAVHVMGGVLCCRPSPFDPRPGPATNRSNPFGPLPGPATTPSPGNNLFGVPPFGTPSPPPIGNPFAEIGHNEVTDCYYPGRFVPRPQGFNPDCCHADSDSDRDDSNYADWNQILLGQDIGDRSESLPASCQGRGLHTDAELALLHAYYNELLPEAEAEGDGGGCNGCGCIGATGISKGVGSCGLVRLGVGEAAGLQQQVKGGSSGDPDIKHLTKGNIPFGFAHG